MTCLTFPLLIAPSVFSNVYFHLKLIFPIRIKIIYGNHSLYNVLTLVILFSLQFIARDNLKNNNVTHIKIT